MKIALISDSHDDWDRLEKAVNTSNENDCEVLYFLGDLIAPPGIDILAKFKGQVKLVLGNNDGEIIGLMGKASNSDNVQACGNVCEDEIDGKKIFTNHYPRISELAAKSGEFDVSLFGHNHEFSSDMINNCLLLNPGSAKNGNCAIIDLETLKVEKVVL